ncbi:hypothetical protein D3C75_605500 [compost metagenome]
MQVPAMIRVSVFLENIRTLTDDELLRVISACDSEIARCKVAAKSVALLRKYNTLQRAKALFLLEQIERQTIEC